MKYLIRSIAFVGIVLTGCSSGGSGTPSVSDGTGNQGSDLAYNACESSYYSGIIGTYSGDYDYVQRSPEGDIILSCVYAMTISIQGTPDVVVDQGQGTNEATSDGCSLNGSYQGTVDQRLFLESSDPLVYQCIAPQGSLVIGDPNDSVINPEIFYENINYPVLLRAIGPAELPSRGPYSLDTDVSARYVNVFGSTSPVARFLEIEANGGFSVLPPENSVNVDTISNFIKE